MSGKYALIIGNTEYTDSGLAQLTAPGKDAEDFARVLRDKEIGAFDDVNILLNQSSSAVNEAIDEFFDQKKSDDLLVLYFSGHGVRDDLGALYLAVKNTKLPRLRTTAVKSDFVREVMAQSRSKRQVLILDCCMSGAFTQGTKAATGVSIGTASAFESGYGHVILTASDSTQFAWEGDQVIGETENSLFTHYLIQGLEGEADIDSDGRITVDELYDYTYEKVRSATPKQTPSKFASKQQGEIILRQNIRIEDVKPVSLSDQLVSETESLYPEIRLRAVEQLAKLLNGKNLGQARSAREALEKISAEDDSRRVAQLAKQVLASQPDDVAENEKRLALQKKEQERKEKEEAERLAAQKKEKERQAQEKLEAERLRIAREKEELAHRNTEKRNRARQVAFKAIQNLLPKLKILALVLVVAFVGYLLWKGITQKTTPGIGSTMIGKDSAILMYVPKGEFTMGSENGTDDEKPVHTVYLDAFWIDQTEVTNKQYKTCVNAGACEPPSDTSNFNNSNYEQHPVVYVDWNMAKAYCDWAGGDLPTEAQWEKAARGTDGRTYPWGENIDCDKANYQSSCAGSTTPVGSYKSGKSPYGAYDMTGNVWEWVNDSYGEDYYQNSPSSNPGGPVSGAYRVLRGGSWDNIISYTQSSLRLKFIPSGNSYIVGFRCARAP